MVHPPATADSRTSGDKARTVFQSQRPSNHQTHNAAALAEAGAAIQLAEARLTPYTLAQEVTALVSDRARLESLGTLARGRGHPDAAPEIVSKILTLIP